MYEFARRPKWVVSHILVALAIVVMIGLSLWQLDRLDQRRARNDEVTTRLDEPVTPIGDLVSADDPYEVGESLRWRPVTVTGRYVAEDEVLILGRTYNSSPGYWALTPVMVDETTAVAVNRGWVPFEPGPGEPRPASAPPEGQVTVQGFVRETVEAQGLQSSDPSDGVLDALARVDLARYRQQLDYDLLPVFVQLQDQQPPAGDIPIPVPLPSLDEGPHLSYAFQWAAFSLIALVGYPLVLRRVARSEARPGRHSDIPVDYL